MAGFDEGKGRTVSTSVNTSALAIQRDVGAELRRLRLEAGFATQTAAAKQLKCSQNKISYVESGKRWPDDALLKRMLKVYGVEEPKRTEILTTIRTGKSIDRSWWQEPKYRSLITGRFGRIFPLETRPRRCGFTPVRTCPGCFRPGITSKRWRPSVRRMRARCTENSSWRRGCDGSRS